MGFLTGKLRDRDQRLKLALLAAGAWLSFTAGFVNSALLCWVGLPVSHMSGAVSHLSTNLAGYRELTLGLIVLVTVAFLAGAVLSGMLIGSNRFYTGERYGIALLIEAGLLLGAGYLAWRGEVMALPIAAMACGLQNALASSYHGIVLRTTHVTGVVTDLGLLIGHRLRGHPVSGFQGILLTLLLAGFACGGFAGAVGVAHLGPGVIAWPAVPCALVGVIYVIARVRSRRGG